MPTASVKPYVSDERARTRLPFDIWIPIAVAVALLVVAVLAPRLQPGPFVGRVAIVNHSDYAFDVEVAGAKGDDWMPLGTVAAHATTSIAQVYSQGSTWTFRFAVQARVLGSTVLTRAELAAAGWQVVIPAEYESQLKRAGVVPTA